MSAELSEIGASPVALSTKRLEKACAAIAACKNIEDVVGLLNKAEAMRSYMKREKASSEGHADCWEIVQHARRHLGQLCKELPQHPTGGGRPKKTSKAREQVSKSATLRELGVSRTVASQLERLAAVPKAEWHKRIKVGRQSVIKNATAASLTATSAAEGYDGDEYGTPEPYADAAREVFGGSIELDPASNAMAQNVIRAERFYTKHDSGLVVPWKARTLWLNPPYSNPLCGQFVEKFLGEYQKSNFTHGIVLVNNVTDVEWFQWMLEQYHVCFPKGRIGFLYNGKPITQNRQGQAFFYAGPHVALFIQVFGRFGRVDEPCAGHPTRQ